MKFVNKEEKENEETILLSCPFCGHKAFIEYPDKDTTIIGCTECSASVFGEEKEKVVNEWNTRTKDGIVCRNYQSKSSCN